ncbi:MAG: aminotransferase class V-fold PLP-dependent enzyme [Bacteroidales bacterium]|nr:aminotransferase class V-fold PLP-dependent enzyme [Bacteroidales bacterium]
MERRNFLAAMGFLTGGAMTGLRGNSLQVPEETISSILSGEGDMWSVVRRQFRFPDGFTYLNCGGIGPVPLHIRSIFSDLWNRMEENPSPGHDMTRWNNLKSDLAPVLGPGVKPSEIALVSCATEGINIILNGLPLKRGDEVITSTHEHPAVNIPLINNMKRRGVVVRTFDPDLVTGMNNLEKIKNLSSKKTKLILISHRTCTTGQLFPMKEIGDFARTNGIWYGLDGAQSPGSRPLEIVAWNVDFYTFSAHKWLLGPRRTGVLYVREEMQDMVEPVTIGAYSDREYNLAEGRLEFHNTAQRYEFGTQNELLFFGLQESVRLINDIGLDRIREYDESLSEYFHAGLKRIPSVIVISPEERQYRTSMISFKIQGMTASAISSALLKGGIRVRTVGESGLDAIRVSFHIFNNLEDADKALNKIEGISH